MNYCRFPKEARFAFGVAITLKEIDGEWCEVAVKMVPFEYHSRLMVAPERMTKEFWVEVRRVNKLKGGAPWNNTKDYKAFKGGRCVRSPRRAPCADTAVTV
jgi:hypothetical protein